VNRPLQHSLRGLGLWCLLSIVAFLWARPIEALLTPFIEGVVDLFESDYAAQVAVVDSKDGPEIEMTCVANRPLRLPNGTLVPFLGSFRCARTDAVHALAPLVVFGVGLLAWPLASRRELVRRLLWGVPLFALVVALTTPLLLSGLANTVLRPDTFRSDAQLTALLQPFVFMEMGGLFLVPLLAACLGIRLGGPGYSSAAATLRS
jgi:hypothetical protein